MNTKDKGDTGVCATIGEFGKLGIICNPMLSDNFPFDLVAIIPRECTYDFYKIQVKAICSKTDAKTVFRIMQNNWRTKTQWMYKKWAVDAFSLYDIRAQKVYLIGFDELIQQHFPIYHTGKKKNDDKYELSEKRIKEVFNYDVILPTFKIPKIFSLVCKCCGKKFESTYHRVFFCSKECRNIDKEKHRVFVADKETLEKLIKTTPMVQIGKMYGVSDNSIRKRCKRLGIELPTGMAGEWAKRKAQEKRNTSLTNDKENL